MIHKQFEIALNDEQVSRAIADYFFEHVFSKVGVVDVWGFYYDDDSGVYRMRVQVKIKEAKK